MARWEEFLDLQSRNAVFQKVNADNAAAARPVTVDPLVTERISYINNRAPWLAPKTQVALAKSYASDMAVDKVAGMASIDLVRNPEQSYTQLVAPPKNYWVTPSAVQARINVGQGKKDQDIGVLDTLYGAFKQASRVGTAISMSAGELLSNAASFKVEGAGPLNWLNPFSVFNDEAQNNNPNAKNFLNSLSIWQLLSDWENQGEGFFISEDQMSRQAEAARQFR